MTTLNERPKSNIFGLKKKKRPCTEFLKYVLLSILKLLIFKTHKMFHL